MQFESAKMIADVYDGEISDLVRSIVRSTGASMVLVRGRAVRDFRAKLLQMSVEEKKLVSDRYVGIDGKSYDSTSFWRSLWDRILDTTFFQDAGSVNRSRTMARSEKWLPIAEAIDARSPNAVPSGIVTYSRALNDLWGRVESADNETEKHKLLGVISKAFVAALEKIGGKRRLKTTRADAQVIDAAIIAACLEDNICNVDSGVVAAAKPAVKRSRPDDDSTAKTDDSRPGDYDKLEHIVGSDRAAQFAAWLVDEAEKALKLYPDAKVSDFTIVNGNVEEYVGEG